MTFTYMQEWLTLRIQKTVTIPEPLCTIHSPSYMEWEALSTVKFFKASFPGNVNKFFQIIQYVYKVMIGF